jgi:hypothetical protein
MVAQGRNYICIRRYRTEHFSKTYDVVLKVKIVDYHDEQDAHQGVENVD